MTTRVKLLDTTLRDGSYAVDYQLTAKDTAVIAAALEDAGVRLIEGGHGLGLGASGPKHGIAAETDEAYIEAATAVLHSARFGVFLIPGIGQTAHLREAARLGIGFVRIGVNVTNVDPALEFVDLARSLGLVVSVNFMKTYALSAPEVAARAEIVARAGAHVVAVVDSSGGMLPEEVKAYCGAVHEASGVEVGFHGHDNLGLAIANTLAAVEGGATVVDTSLAGLGRSAGNAITEITTMVLKRAGFDLGLDEKLLMDASENLVKPLTSGHRHDPISITSGFAHFHSSFLDKVVRHSRQHEVDVRDVIVQLCAHDRVEAPDNLVAEIARNLASERSRVLPVPASSATRSWAQLRGGTSSGGVEDIARQVSSVARKSGRQSVFNLVAPARPNGRSWVSPIVQSNFRYVIGSAEIASEEEFCSCLSVLDGQVDILLVDVEQKGSASADRAAPANAMVRKSDVLAYHDTDVWARAMTAELAELMEGTVGPVAIVGWNRIALKVALHLAEQRTPVRIAGDKPEFLAPILDSLAGAVALDGAELVTFVDTVAAADDAVAVLGCALDGLQVGSEAISAMRADGVVLDGTIGSVAAGALDRARERGIRVVRVDMRAALASEIDHLTGAATITKAMMGRSVIAGQPVVAGGLIGDAGDVVVDSISRPRQVLGVADGLGHLVSNPDAAARERMREVELQVLRTQPRLV